MTWDGQLSLGTNRQLWDTNVPALDDLANTNGTLERLTSVTGRVELLAVLQGSSVVDGDGVTNTREGLAITLLDDFDLSVLRSRHSECGIEGSGEVVGAERLRRQTGSADTG